MTIFSGNDNFANAITLSGASGSTTGSNVGATKESGEPVNPANGGGASVWWKWTAPSSGNVSFSTSGSAFDTIMAIYTGNAVNALNLITYNDDENYPSIVTSIVTFNATAGTTYYISVDGYSAATGSIALTWNQLGSGGSLVISETDGLSTLGSQGGPFNPNYVRYTLSASSGTVNWSLSGLPDWLTPSATSGTVNTSGTQVYLTINTNVNSKAVGTYGPTTVTFTNTTNNQGTTTRTVKLVVSPNACEAVTRGQEFGGDGKSDILWRSDSGGIGFWGTAPASATFRPTGASWRRPTSTVTDVPTSCGAIPRLARPRSGSSAAFR